MFIIAVVGMLIAACGADEPEGDCLAAEDGVLVAAPCDVPEGVTAEPPPPPPSDNGGAQLDPAFVVFRNNGCAGCHTVDGTPASGTLGPNLTSVGAQGAAFVEESIRNPGAVLAAGFSDGIMPANFGDTMSDEDISAIVDWLVSQ